MAARRQDHQSQRAASPDQRHQAQQGSARRQRRCSERRWSEHGAPRTAKQQQQQRVPPSPRQPVAEWQCQWPGEAENSKAHRRRLGRSSDGRWQAKENDLLVLRQQRIYQAKGVHLQVSMKRSARTSTREGLAQGGAGGLVAGQLRRTSWRPVPSTRSTTPISTGTAR